MARVCVDACFLIGLYDQDDQHHATAIRQFSALFGKPSAGHHLVAPWPILYECLGTRYARDPRKTALLNQHWNILQRSQRLVLLEDKPFREQSLAEQLQDRLRNLSLVDRVLRAMILDRKSLFDIFLTYNTADFADACGKRGIPLLNEKSEPLAYVDH
jgi:predicted nucleic acid-binding protein